MDERGVKVQEHRFEDDVRFPNNPELPLLFYPNLLGGIRHGTRAVKGAASRERLGRSLGERRGNEPKLLNFRSCASASGWVM